ncbi:MAG: metalloregulator ArsR/SmtB family transcription factor [Desulfobacterales bacterium]|nr:metalloregulator ArsR/SmtB family transcription factor [Desulfobacterales bacterium]
MIDSREMARVFKILSVDARVRIVTLLKERTMCVNALAKHLEMSAAAVSQHLRVLRDSGVVQDCKSGNFVHYSLNPETLEVWRSMTSGLLECDDRPVRCSPNGAGSCGK